MKKYIKIIFFLFATATVQAQILDCKIVVNAAQTGKSNLSVFSTLENSIKDFVNQTQWTETGDVDNHQRINCSMFINITKLEGNSFSGTIQVQSSRPVFNSTYASPVFNFNDEQLAFNYTEHEPLTFNRNSFNSNLSSILSFYVYTILGLDADTFDYKGGEKFHREASQIVNVAQQSGTAGWRAGDGNNTRYRLNSDLLNNSYEGYRKALYEYHRLGLDKMVNNPAEAKENVASSMENLQKMNQNKGNSLLLRVFFDAKAAEIGKIFAGGPSVPVEELLNTLSSIAPLYSENWENIKY